MTDQLDLHNLHGSYLGVLEMAWPVAAGEHRDQYVAAEDEFGLLSLGLSTCRAERRKAAKR